VVKYPPNQITKKDFHKILEVSDTEEKAMWILSMVGAYYTIDISTVPKSAINFEDKTIVYRRTKTNEPRALFMDDYLIGAIKAYQKESQHKCDTLFCNQRGGLPYVKDRIGVKFRRCLLKAGIKGKYGHNNFRDSVTSVCLKSKVYEPSIDAILGHQISGEKKKYRDPEQNPQIAEEASKAVAKYYFY